MRYRGIILFLSKKGFGFVRRLDDVDDGQGPDFFFHHSQLPGTGYKTIEKAAFVTFEIAPSETRPGKVRAVKIQRVASKQPGGGHERQTARQ